MYSRNFANAPPPNNYNGTLYRKKKEEASETSISKQDEEMSVHSENKWENETEKHDSLLSKGFSIHLDTEDLLLLGLVFLLMANGEKSDMMLIISLLFATGIFF